MSHIKLMLAAIIFLCTSNLSGQSHNIDSLSKASLTKHTNDLTVLPIFKRIAAEISFKELDLSKCKVKNKEGTFNLEVNICGYKPLFPKSNDLTSSGSVKFNDLLLENGNILVANGWVHTLVVGHATYNNIITTYTMGIITSKLYLMGNRVVNFDSAPFNYSDCQ